jgi:predicted Fe-S protein YdhL (DUF1289 family)
MQTSVPSPCIGACVLNPERYCTGCYRHLDEIAAWAAMSPAEQRAVLQKVAQRKQRA